MKKILFAIFLTATLIAAFVFGACNGSAPCENHDWGEAIIEREATCSSEGVKKRVCNACGEEFRESIPTTTHTYDDGEVVKEATCKESGERLFTCKDCNATRSEVIEKLTTHAYDEGKITKEATCKESGERLFTCKDCNATRSEVVEKLTTHAYDEGKITKEATCKDEGVTTYTCKVCDATKTEKIEKLTTHAYDNGKITKEATCKESGERLFTCLVCSATKTEEIEKLTTHTYDNGKVTKEATCKESGERLFTCQDCGATRSEVIEKLTTHTYDEGKITKEATCKDEGVTTYTCKVCDATKTEKIEKLTTHAYDDGKVVKEATCKDEGVTTYTCKVCDVTKTEKIEKLTTHAYDDGKITKEATCKDEGVTTYTCKVCDATKTEKIEKLTNHSWDNGKVTKEPTCKEAGVKTYVCTTCGATDSDPIPKNENHSWNNGVLTTQPTEEQEGVRTYTCYTCGATRTEKVDKLLPVNRGSLAISDITAWLDYPAADFRLRYDKPQYAEALSYQYDTTALYVDASKNTVKALKSGKYVVRASSKHFSASFTVNAEVVDKSDTDNSGKSKWSAAEKFASRATERENIWKNKGNDGTTTAFIGDSFFDDSFWTNFYTGEYFGKCDALRLGISATTTYDWEDWINGWFGKTNPRNVVMHMGTNNIYDDGDSAAIAISSLKRMFTMMHDKLPNAKIYWFSISQRSYNTTLQEIVRTVNASMKAWCDERDYITYIHTVDTLTASMLKDNIHPLPDCYYVFRDALKNTDIQIDEISEEQFSRIDDIANTMTETIANGKGMHRVSYKSGVLNRNFILEGKLDIIESGNNAHIQFGIDGGSNRVLLWDNDSNKSFLLCIPYTTSGVPADDTYTLTAGKPLTISWKIVMTNDDMYFFIGDELKIVYTGLPAGDLKLGSESAAVKFYDMTAKTLVDDSGEYLSELGKYDAYVSAYGGVEAGKFRV